MDNKEPPKLRPARGSAIRFTPPSSFPEPARSLLQNALARAKAALAEEFKGITVEGSTAAGLQTIAAVASVGLKLSHVVEVPPYHYGVVFERSPS